MNGAHWHLACTLCGKTFEPQEARYLCLDCGRAWRPGTPLEGVLEVRYDYGVIAAAFDPRDPSWDLLLPVPRRFYPRYPVGRTPCFHTERLGIQLGIHGLWMKNDGQNPSGSLKDRASFLMAALALCQGETTLVAASTGNAASALAAVAASAGLQAVIYVPRTTPRAKLAQLYVHGAKVCLVDGTYDDAFRLSIEHTQRHGGLNRNTAYHPFTVEGKKTVAFEIYTACGRAPDYVVVPTGDGAILSGVHKGFKDLRELGLISALPHLIAVQAESSNAIARYVATGIYEDAAQPTTIADSIAVRTPAAAHLARRALSESQGFCVTVTDEEILNGQQLLARTTGIFAEPAAASVVPGLAKAELPANALVVLLVTGHGLKDVDAVLRRLPPEQVVS